MKMKHFSLMVLSVMGGLFLSCDVLGPRIVGPEKVIRFTITPSEEPTISWGDGPVGDLSISERKSEETLWGLKTEGRDGIESPIQYGTLLQGAQWILDSEVVHGDSTVKVNPLKPNREYIIFAMRLTKDHIGSSRFNIEEGLDEQEIFFAH